MASPPDIEKLAPLFPKLEIQWLAGQGGMGAVYNAIQQPLGRTVALKILPSEFTGDALHKVRFGIEAKAMSRLAHPNLVQLYDFGETDGISWMIQEWVEGKTLYQMEMEGGLTPEETDALVCQVCAGLGHAHSNGVIHRDIKPSNIMMNGEGTVKLIDFGLARATKGGSNSLISTIASCKYATVEYAAPETWIEGAMIDHRADIFSLGVLLYEALTGKRPSGVFQMPSDIRPELDPRFDQVVVKAMQAAPDDRYHSCEEFMQALQLVLLPPADAIPAAAPKTAPATPHTAMPGAGAVAPASDGGLKGKIIVIATLCLLLIAGFLGLRWKMNGTKELQDRADKRHAEELASREDIKKTIAAEKKARLAKSSTAPKQQPHALASMPLGKKPDISSPQTSPTTSTPPRQKPESHTTEPKVTAMASPLAELDEKLHERSGTALKSYQSMIAELREKYTAECRKQDKLATAAGNLDAVLFWQNEIKRLVKSGEPPRETTGVPPRATSLRKAWHNHIAPKKNALLKLQKSYLADCAELEKDYSKTGDAAASKTIRERREAVSGFPAFLRLCLGK